MNNNFCANENKMLQSIEDLLQFEQNATTEFQKNPTLARALRNLEFYYLARAEISDEIKEGRIRGELPQWNRQLRSDLATGFYNSVINIYDLLFNKRKVIDPTGSFYIINSIQDLHSLEQKATSEFKENPTFGQALLNFECYYNARRLTRAKIKKGEIKGGMPQWNNQFTRNLFDGYLNTIVNFTRLVF